MIQVMEWRPVVTVENPEGFPRSGGSVLGFHGSGSFHGLGRSTFSMLKF
jgi:hypothetical protein